MTFMHMTSTLLQKYCCENKENLEGAQLLESQHSSSEATNNKEDNLDEHSAKTDGPPEPELPQLKGADLTSVIQLVENLYKKIQENTSTDENKLQMETDETNKITKEVTLSKGFFLNECIFSWMKRRSDLLQAFTLANTTFVLIRIVFAKQLSMPTKRI